MNRDNPRGMIYQCPVCRAELVVLSRQTGDFAPRCCNTDMAPLSRRAVFYVCPVCGAEIVELKDGGKRFRPRCCNTDMLLEAA